MKSNQNEIISIPVETLRRIPSYLKTLNYIQSQQRDYISIQRIAHILGLLSTTIHNDFLALEIPDGYNGIHDVKFLIDKMEQHVGANNPNEAFLAGISECTPELLNDKHFNTLGLKIVAIFDKDPAFIGQTIQGVMVLHPSKITSLAQRMHVSHGIISSFPEDTEYLAEKLIEAGINIIWNYSDKYLPPVADCIIDNSSRFHQNNNSSYSHLTHYYHEPE